MAHKGRTGWLLAAVVLAGLLGSGLAPSWAQQAVEAVLGVINGQPVPRATYVARLEQRYGYEAAQSLALEALIMDAAAKANLTPTDAEVAAELVRFQHEHFKDDQRLFADWLARYGRTEAEVRASVRVQVAQFKLRTQGLTIDEAALRNFWKQHEADYQRAEAVIFRQIIITSPTAKRRLGDGGPSAEARVRAMDVLNRIRGGLKFEEAVAQYSDDPEAKRTGGLVGPASMDLLQARSAPLARALAELQPDQMSPQPVADGYGYVLVRLERRFPAFKGDFETLRTRVTIDFLAEKMEAEDIFVGRLLKTAQVQWSDPRFAAMTLTGRWISPSGLSLPGWLRERR